MLCRQAAKPLGLIDLGRVASLSRGLIVSWPRCLVALLSRGLIVSWLGRGGGRMMKRRGGVAACCRGGKVLSTFKCWIFKVFRSSWFHRSQNRRPWPYFIYTRHFSAYGAKKFGKRNLYR